MNIGETVPLSLGHEQRVGQLLSHLCFSMLGNYATSIKDDEELLAQNQVQGAVAQAVKFRLSRKRCLQQVIVAPLHILSNLLDPPCAFNR